MSLKCGTVGRIPVVGFGNWEGIKKCLVAEPELLRVGQWNTPTGWELADESSGEAQLSRPMKLLSLNWMITLIRNL